MQADVALEAAGVAAGTARCGWPAACRRFVNDWCLPPARPETRQDQDFWGVRWSAALKAYLAPFVMQAGKHGSLPSANPACLLHCTAPAGCCHPLHDVSLLESSVLAKKLKMAAAACTTATLLFDSKITSVQAVHCSSRLPAQL